MNSLDPSTSLLDSFPADPLEENSSRPVQGALYSYVSPRTPSHPELVAISSHLAHELGMDPRDPDFLSVLSGQKILSGTRPYAMCYGGHQFGNWAGQLGDGRVINLFSVNTLEGEQYIQLKGAGETPYSRGGDGLAVLRSSVREYLMSEAMHALGIPTTRALALIRTGDDVIRDRFYTGHEQHESGAIVSRAAPSFIRFGSFEIFASRGDTENLRRLADYTIREYYKDIRMDSESCYVDFFEKIVERSIETLLHWQGVGFVHGVLNTDNMSILGLTLDYGPFGFLEQYDPDWTPNTSDSSGRYSYGNQPQIVLWNLAQLARALSPLFGENKRIHEILSGYQDIYERGYFEMMRSKLGFYGAGTNDQSLLDTLLQLFAISKIDMTIFFRLLSQVEKTGDRDVWNIMKTAFYTFEKLDSRLVEAWNLWFQRYQNRLREETVGNTERSIRMNQVNPKYILRNWMLEEAIVLAEQGNYSRMKEFQEILQYPYDELPQYNKWFMKNPHPDHTSQLSCSS